MDMMVAHIRKDGEVQSLHDHLFNVAEYAESNCNKIGLHGVGELIGLLHDLGKATVDFQDYIRGESGASRGEIDHSTAGAQYLQDLLGDEQSQYRRLAGQIMSLAIVSHHSGLIDCIDNAGGDTYGNRLRKDRSKTRYQEAARSIDDRLRSRLDRCCISALDSMETLIKEMACFYKVKDDMFFFALGLLSRFVLSSLVDADHRDTSEFETGYVVPGCPDWSAMASMLELKLSEFDKQDRISKIRSRVSDLCLGASGKDRGTYTLSVPTGGGKTLASLRFALNHARIHGMERIIYVIPYTSIIEQNAKVIRDVLSDDGRIVCEYHSNVDLGNDDDGSNTMYDFWDSPIIITTMVQFLDALFNSGIRRARRMQSLANSVLIFDEIQVLPVKTVSMFNGAINFLTKWCGSTAVLCTATQPLLDRVKSHPLILQKGSEIIDDVKDLEDQLKRVVPEVKDGVYDAESISDMVGNLIDEYDSVLVVTNTKSLAARIHERVADSIGTRVLAYHLSTNMCPVHRSETILRIKDNLGKRKVVCVSTQLIEAGVDIDFNVVVRCMAGLDSIVQAAGRCNRNGKMEGYGRLIVVETAENVSRLKDIDVGHKCARSVIHDFDDILSGESMRRYYEYYFFKRGSDMLYQTDNPERTMYDMLSLNKSSVSMYCSNTRSKPLLRQSFSEANHVFEVIEKVRGVIVCFNEESREIVSDLCSGHYIDDYRALLRRAQKYTVNTYRFNDLLRTGAAKEVYEGTGIYFLVDGYYDDCYGLKDDSKLETMIVRGMT